MAFSPPVDPRISFLTSGFGVRTSRRTGNPTFHAGVDFRGAVGDPIYAASGGIVDVVTQDVRHRTSTFGYGACISIHHGAINQWTVYAHLDETFVQPGQVVSAGELIGRCGRASNGKFPSMGPHLHFEVRNPKSDGSSPFPGPYRRYNIDPQPWLGSYGIRLVQRGIQLGAPAIDPTTQPRPPGLGNVTGQLDLDAVGLPEEPLRELDTFEPVKPQLLVALAAAGVVTVASGAWLALEARK